MKAVLRKISPFIIAAALLCSNMPVMASNYEIPGICQVQADAGAVHTVKTLDYGYGHNTYLSLRDLAMVLKDTDKSFSLEITRNTVSLNPGGVYAPAGAENAPWEDSGNPDIALRRNEFKVNGEEMSYYTLIMKLPSGYYDCFMMAADLAMILDVDITVPGAGFLQMHTQEPFRVSPAALEQAGYFYGVNGVLVGDATTGEVYYRYQSDISYPIASTSKLMTCLLAMEALAAGQIALEEQVTVSEAVWQLADSDDGVIPLEAGMRITLRELLLGALLPSSNECALALAERIAGSEEAFVQRMNQKALELGLSQAVFFNSNGLPAYTEDPVPAKCQNRMSAEDMFRLASYLLKVFPQVTDITSMETAMLESLNLEVRNTNPLLQNLPGIVTGLKTGTTNKAGACLVTSLAADDGAMEHDLVVIVLGTEDNIERGRVSGLLARYALQAFYGGTEDPETGADDRFPGDLPTHAEAAVDWILRTARQKDESDAP
ncbi:MAG: serine hydrolase [Eubacterium sp.]|nr:serine hydrolase [Eubacterium sp.]MCM1215791.1 serine hydrolase [Lachnospiraceae bacterium]MCM1304123.1 serine hydrolase [Butyrivibrio sp.]MCM1344081.1 serine hydrolase [Muribaculaceae bacterium]MCM1238354.1 serine hydrolase [Lachnospiraceae bacterium]